MFGEKKIADGGQVDPARDVSSNFLPVQNKHVTWGRKKGCVKAGTKCHKRHFFNKDYSQFFRRSSQEHRILMALSPKTPKPKV